MLLPRLLLLILLLFAAPAGAQDFPQLTGRVVDNAELLSPADEAALTAKLKALEQRTMNQFVVVTMPGLGGETIEQWGLRLGNGWGVGKAERDNGVLLIVAPEERKVRIEVGLGLEDVLTNAICQDIIDRQILPKFRAEQMSEGIRAGVDAVVDFLSGDATALREAA